MKDLSELHFDALGEFISIGTRHAFQSLGHVIGESVQSSVSKVDLIERDKVGISTLLLKVDIFGVLTLEFTSGEFNAEVMLLFAQEDVLRIVRNMMKSEIEPDVIREFEGEAMCELGNIMINACLSSIADMLHIPIGSSLPHYSVESHEEIVTHIKNATREFVLASRVNLSIEENPIESTLLFLIDSTSLSNIIAEIEQ